MENTLDKLKDYVDYAIEDMKSYIDWARDHMQDETRNFRVDWALRGIECKLNDGIGAISFSWIWAKSVSEEDANVLKEKLMNAYFKARKDAIEKI